MNSSDWNPAAAYAIGMILIRRSPNHMDSSFNSLPIRRKAISIFLDIAFAFPVHKVVWNTTIIGPLSVH